MATKKNFESWRDLRRWRKLPHEKPPNSALLTYKLKAIKSKRIRMGTLFKALSQHCPAEYEVLGRTLNRHPPAYETLVLFGSHPLPYSFKNNNPFFACVSQILKQLQIFHLKSYTHAIYMGCQSHP
jgi:hypothetical protein